MLVILTFILSFNFNFNIFYVNFVLYIFYFDSIFKTNVVNIFDEKY